MPRRTAGRRWGDPLLIITGLIIDALVIASSSNVAMSSATICIAETSDDAMPDD